MNLPPALASALKDKQLLIFDFDGTIADTSPLHAQAFSETLAPMSVSFCYSQIAGMRTAEALLSCFDRAGVSRPGSEDLRLLASEKQRRVRELIETSLEPLSDMDRLLHWAKSRYTMALVTSGSRVTVSLALRKLGYQSLFSTQIFAEDVRVGKPDPEGLHMALQSHNCQPEQALVFEDSEAGFEAAKAARVNYVDITLVKYRLDI